MNCVMNQQDIDDLSEAFRSQGLTWSQTNFAVSMVRNSVAAERERVARTQPRALRFAGWFTELKSGMSYRLWEQGGYEQGPNDVALYEA